MIIKKIREHRKNNPTHLEGYDSDIVDFLLCEIKRLETENKELISKLKEKSFPPKIEKVECEGYYQASTGGWYIECIKCGKSPKEHSKEIK